MLFIINTPILIVLISFFKVRFRSMLLSWKHNVTRSCMIFVLETQRCTNAGDHYFFSFFRTMCVVVTYLIIYWKNHVSVFKAQRSGIITYSTVCVRVHHPSWGKNWNLEHPTSFMYVAPCLSQHVTFHVMLICCNIPIILLCKAKRQ